MLTNYTRESSSEFACDLFAYIIYLYLVKLFDIALAYYENL